MGSEKSEAPGAVVTFARRAEVDRRIAGVAAAARIVRDLQRRGVHRVRLAVPGGGAADRATTNDLARLCPGATIEIVDRDAAGALTPGEVIAAPRLSTAAILRATGKPGDGPVSRWLNRPVSRRISALLLLIPGIRPIHATIGTALLALLMFAALLVGGHAGLIAGGLLFHAASVFDGVDGEIARATFRASDVGASIDTVVDWATNFLFIAGLTIGLAAQTGGEALLIGGWGLLLFASGIAMLAWRTARPGRPFVLDLVKHRYRHRFPGWFVPLLIRGMTVVSSRDFFALLFALLILAGWPKAVLVIFAAAATVWILFVVAAFAASRQAVPAERNARLPLRLWATVIRLSHRGVS